MPLNTQEQQMKKDLFNPKNKVVAGFKRILNSLYKNLAVKHSSTTDSLTRLCNRRGFDEAMETRYRDGDRDSDYLSVVVLDLDGFRRLNDMIGHKASDKALILLADVLRAQMRQADTIARLGGDKFAVLMPNTKADDCNSLCHLLNHSIETKLNEAFSYPISVSIGFATVKNSAASSVDILSIANRALYRAKAIGNGWIVREYANN